MLRFTFPRAFFAGMCIAAILAVPLFVFAACGTPGNDPYCIKEYAGLSGLSTSGNLPQTIGSIVRMVLALLGVIFFGLLFYAGLKWMTARGNEEIAAESRRIIESASIGLVIVLISYALATFVIDRIFT